MKSIVFITLLVAAVSAAPVEESTKTKRGIYGLGHSLLAPAPLLHAPAPLIHAPAPILPAPLALHAPLVAPAPYIAKTVIPSAPLISHAPLLSAPLALGHAPLALGLGHSLW